MKKIKEELRTKVINGKTIHNIPFNIYDESCYHGCCEHESSVSGSNILKLDWLEKVYMPNNKMKEFDFTDDWTEEVNNLFIHYREKRNK